MNKKKIIMIILIVAAAAMMWTKLAPWFLPRRGRAPSAAVPPPEALAVAVPAVEAPAVEVPAVVPPPAQKVLESNLVRLKREFDLGLWSKPDIYDRELKNPFIMRICDEEVLPDLLDIVLSLEGIIWAVDNPLVIIDGKVYGIRDVIMDGLEIKAIERDYITVTDGEKEREFRLNRKDGL
ncbi:hypothetical protein LR003_01160 [candidate division NPL-UPA2 bacterium]|nr:hypothetical protein [candidate division NPL-UPA2 bacterium]